MGVYVHLAVHELASVVSLKQALLIAERTKQMSIQGFLFIFNFFLIEMYTISVKRSVSERFF